MNIFGLPHKSILLTARVSKTAVNQLAACGQLFTAELRHPKK